MSDYRPEQLRFKNIPNTNETIKNKTVVLIGNGQVPKKVLNFLLTKNGVNIQGRVAPKGTDPKFNCGNVRPDYIISDEKNSFTVKFKVKTDSIGTETTEQTGYHYTQLDDAKQMGIPIISFQQAFDIMS